MNPAVATWWRETAMLVTGHRSDLALNGPIVHTLLTSHLSPLATTTRSSRLVLTLPRAERGRRALLRIIHARSFNDLLFTAKCPAEDNRRPRVLLVLMKSTAEE